MSQNVCEWCATPFRARGSTPRRFCCRTHADEWRRRDKPSDEWLRAQYIDAKRTANDIAREVGRDPKRVWEWLRAAGVPTRPRGAASSPGTRRPGQSSTFKGKRHTAESRAAMTAGRRKVSRESYANNGGYLKARRGPAHPNWRGGHTPDRQAFYSSPEWKLAARTVWGRDRGICQRCDAVASRTAGQHERWHVHHVIGFADVTTRADVANLILLCPACHRWVHGKTNVDLEYIG